MHLKCSACDRTFTKTEHLRRHERSHTKEKPFTCAQCGRSYARSDVLARHLRMHSRKNDYRGASSPPNRTASSTSDTTTYDLGEGDGLGSADNGDSLFRATLSRQQDQGQYLDSQQRRYARPDTAWSQAVSRTPPQSLRPVLAEARAQSMHGAGFATHEAVSNSGSAPLSRPKLGNGQDTPMNGPFAGSASRSEISTHEQPRNLATHDFPIGFDSVALSAGLVQGTHRSIGTTLPAVPLHVAYTPSTMSSVNSHADHDNNDLHRWLRVARQTNPVNAILQLEGNIEPFRQLNKAIDRPGKATVHPTATLPTNFGQFPRVEQNWYSRIGTQPTGQLREKRWYDIVRSMSGDLFSLDTLLQSSSKAGCRESVDEVCRQRLIRAVYPEVTNPFDPAATCTAHHLQLVSERFPACEAFDAALRKYHDSFDREAPFLHRPVFSISTCHPLMVFVMSCIGFVLSGTDDGLFFVHSNFDAVRTRIVFELDRKLTATTKDSLSVFATAFMFLKLAALISDRDHLSPCQLLYSSLLTLAQLHGVFSAHIDHGAEDLYQTFTSLEQRWHAWGRVESFKRIAVSLIRLDSAYCTFLRAPPIIRVAKVQLSLPCDDSLFTAPTAEAWWQLQQQMRLPAILPVIHPSTDLDRLADLGPLSYYTLHSILNYLQLHNADAYQELLDDPTTDHQDGAFVSVPLRLYNRTYALRGLILRVGTFMHVWPKVASQGMADWQRVNCLVFWHYLCLCLTVNQDLIETAAGRDGVRAASRAIDSVAAWSRTPAARRALVHAAHVYKLLAQRQQHEMSSIYATFATFTSALVITLYVFARPSLTHDTSFDPYELTSDVDWTTFGLHGLDESAQHIDQDPSERFIRHGGDWTFDGRPLHGFIGARHVLTTFADLLRTCGRYNFRQMSQILFMMNDMLQQSA